MSKRKTRQDLARADYSAHRSPSARWMSKHRETCGACRSGSVCRLISVCRARGMFDGAS
jgi:hypothetical protein